MSPVPQLPPGWWRCDSLGHLGGTAGAVPSVPWDVPIPPHCPLSPQTKLNEDFTVKAEGTGKGTMTVVTVYNAKVPEKENKCDNFDLRVSVEDVKAGESPSVP